MSIKKGSRTIASSVPVTEWGSIDGTLTDQADLKNALNSKASVYSPIFTGTPLAPTPVVGTDNNQIATTKFVQDALLNSGSDLPDQTGHNGQFLTTNGSVPSWATVNALPSQSGNSGKFLTTNGTNASWATIDLSGKVDKVTSTSSKNRVYIITPSGTQSVLDAEQTGQTQSTIPIRTSSGTIRTATPTDNNDAVNLSYLTSTYDTGVVHTTGNETISGTKTFNGVVKLSSTYGSNEGFLYQGASTGFVALGMYSSGTTWNGNYIQFDTNGDTKLYAKSGQKIVLSSGTTQAPTPEANSNNNNIATTAWVNTKISDVTLTNGSDISIDNSKAINYTGPRYFRLATRTWTYAQWTQYCEKGVTTNLSPSYTVTGIRAGDLVSVEGICSDRNNANVLAWGIAQGEAASGTGNVSVTFLGLNIQENNNLVHKTDDEEISGTKTFTNTIMSVETGNDERFITIKDNSVSASSAPSVQRTRRMQFRDSSDNRIGELQCYKTTNGIQTTGIIASNNMTGSQVNGAISVSVDSSGNAYTYAPTPSSVTDNSTKIATTAWVNSKIQFVNALPANPENGVLYLIPET